MAKHSALLADQPLSSGDLDILQTFLEAWCTENGVDIQGEAAREVAIGLIDWYQFGLTDRSQWRPSADSPPLPASLQALIEQLDR